MSRSRLLRRVCPRAGLAASPASVSLQANWLSVVRSRTAAARTRRGRVDAALFGGHGATPRRASGEPAWRSDEARAADFARERRTAAPELAVALETLRSQAAPMPASNCDAPWGVPTAPDGKGALPNSAKRRSPAASIGQVHRVRTRDGRDLALKVQYPGVAKSIASDVDNVATLLRIARLLPLGLDVNDIAREAKRQLTRNRLPGRGAVS